MNKVRGDQARGAFSARVPAVAAVGTGAELVGHAGDRGGGGWR